MRTLLFTLALVVASLAAAQAEPSDQATVMVRVTEVTPAPRCGDSHLAVLVRMDVLSTVLGTVPPGPLYAYWDCAQVSTPGVGTFDAVLGGVYRLEIQRAAPRGFGSFVGMPPSGHTIYFVAQGTEVPIGGS